MDQQRVSTPPPSEEFDLEMIDTENLTPLVKRAIDSRDAYFWTREEFEQLMDDLRLCYNRVTRDRQRLKNEFRTIEHNIEEYERSTILNPPKRRKKMKLSDQPNSGPFPINLGPPPCNFPNDDGSFCEKVGFCPFHDHKKKKSYRHPMAKFGNRKKSNEKGNGRDSPMEADHVSLLLKAAEVVEKEGVKDEEEDVIQPLEEKTTEEN